MTDLAMDVIQQNNREDLRKFATNTSHWSLVVHKVSSSTAQIWFGTLFATLRKPQLCRLVLYKQQEIIDYFDVRYEDWQRPITRLSQRFYLLHQFEQLEAGQEYSVKLFQQLEKDSELEHKWLELKQGELTTLPNQLPAATDKPFTVCLSSCFYEDKDKGQAAEAYAALYRDKTFKPDVKFMVGDQVYLDIGLDSLSPLTNEVRQRIAEDYAQNWKALSPMLSKGGTWMLPDDHEYWNDYPFYDSLIPTLFMLKVPKVRQAWTRASKDGVFNIQQTSKIDTFKLGNDLSFCIADLRSYRSKTQFIDKTGFAQLRQWAEQLTCPGVLVIPQILVVGKNEHERNLLSFKGQYSKLLEALATSGKDIVVLSGDVHYGRICQVELGNSGAKLVEVVASPMSNLTYANSIAGDVAKCKPTHFPEPNAELNTSLPTKPVAYNKDYHVSTRKGRMFSPYWFDRTTEHFMTVGFGKSADGVTMTVNAWRLRERTTQGMPKLDFKQPFTLTLR